MIPQTVGTLESTPFGELLVQAVDHRLTGTLVLEERSGARHGIYLDAGTPRKAKLGASTVHLGQVLVDTGAISNVVHEETLERALRERVLHGQVLLGEGRISERDLGLALREQLHRQLVQLFRQPADTHYGYFDGQNYLARWGASAAFEPSTLEVLWRGLCDHAPAEAMQTALERIGGLRIKLRELPSDHFAFMGDVERILSLFKSGPRFLRELVDAEPLLEGDIRLVLYFLLLTRSVDLGIPSAPPVGVAVDPFVAPPQSRVPALPTDPSATSERHAPASDAPVRRDSPPSGAAVRRDSPPSGASVRRDSPPPGAYVRRDSGTQVRRDSPPSIPPAVVHSVSIRDELRRLSEKPPRTHYEVLGIAEDAPLRQVQSSFFLLSKHWHPDRLGAEAEDLKSAAARVFDSISSAYRLLADPVARAAYDDELAAGGAFDTPPAVERALTADLAFQKAEQFLARSNLDAAEREAELALKLDPKRAEHIALVAWLAALKPNADERQIGIAFAKAIKAAPGSIKVHYYRGQFLKRTGRHAAALQEFRYVAERDHRHIDAAREVRLYEQRLHRSPKDRPNLAPEEPIAERSAWSRLFKRRHPRSG